MTSPSCDALRQQISATEKQLERLKAELEAKDNAVAGSTPDTHANGTDRDGHNNSTSTDSHSPFGHISRPLDLDEYRRYGRQMIVDKVGLEGQLKLRSASVLIVGCGGLGCPAAMYLASAGVGTLGLVDGDKVDISNLHRQVLHKTRNQGRWKVDSAIEGLRELNPNPTYVPYRTSISAQDAPEIFSSYDVILDCTDNPATRYLISDVAVLLGKSVVSASALRTDGQFVVLNYPPRPPGDPTGGPCYRCIYPKPPPTTAVTNCADGGILGPVVGLMGVMQALETIRIITTPTPRSLGDVADQSTSTPLPHVAPMLHLFSGYNDAPFRSVRIRRRKHNCAVCSAEKTITLDKLSDGSMDYAFFCGANVAVPSLPARERISAAELQRRFPYSPTTPDGDDGAAAERPIFIDTRDETQFGICSLRPDVVNIPISRILGAAAPQPGPDGVLTPKYPPWLPEGLIDISPTRPIITMCRRGNDSQIAVKKLKEYNLDCGGERLICDLKGGLLAWKEEVDPEFPEY